jgi:uncharacterized MAPEG superfamily protein
MTTALWCVLAAALLPYLGTGLAKGGGRMALNANRAPREWANTLEGWPKRAHWAQLNSFEAFPAFAVAVLTAQMLHAPQARLDMLALAFIGFRLGYLVAYLADLATLRSTLWAGGMVCVVWLFVLGA